MSEEERSAQAVNTPPLNSRIGSPLTGQPKLEVVAGAVHTLKSLPRAFSSSKEVRDFAYKEWLIKKEEKKVQEKGLKKVEENVASGKERKEVR